MNIQIFGKKKCFDTKKAQRYFKERGIKFQYIDVLDKGLSKRELRSIIGAVGGFEKLLDDKDENFHLISYLVDEQKEEKLLETHSLYRTPIVRNGKKATVGYHPDVWKLWD